jgi:pimeloyl-ACP methyl ester carboxylesterase
MRIAHCTVALALVASLAGTGQAQTNPPAAQVDFTVFYQGSVVGVEQVTVTRTPEGITISGSERAGPPLGIVTRRAEARYTADWRPLEFIVEGSIREQPIALRTTVSGTTATSQFMQGGAPAQRTDQIAPDAIFLPNMFFGAYAALAARLPGTKAGDQLAAFVPPQMTATVIVKSATDDRVRTRSEVLQFRRYELDLVTAKYSARIEMWADVSGRMLRLTVLDQSFDIVRADIASITSRREQAARPNDQAVTIPAYGFSLMGTLSQPASKPSPAFRFPAIALVGGSEPIDREESVAGVPVFGQLASALADAGFIVVRYDKRGVGQSGGRADTANLSDYADDAGAVVDFLKRRKDVDPARIAMLGYGEGGAVASVAASRGGSIAALVLVAAPGVSGGALALEQQTLLLARLNTPEAERNAKLQLQQKLHLALITGTGLDAVPADLVRRADTPWFRSFLVYDPAKVLKNVEQPILIVHGELDREILPANADKLAAVANARKGRAGGAVKLVKIPAVNHLLVPAQTGEVEEYGKLADRTVSPGAASAIGAWLKEALKAK